MNPGQTEPQIKIKGYAGGLLATMGDGDWDAAQAKLLEQIASQESFFHGAHLAIDVGRHILRAGQLSSLKDSLSSLGVDLTTVLGEASATKYGARMLDIATSLHTPRATAEGMPGLGSCAEIISESLRPGRKVISDTDLVIMGDVGSEIQVEARGSIIIWGNLRGIVHAGVESNEAAQVCALNFRPVQLRIAGMWYHPRKRISLYKAEVAYIKNGEIMIEPWNKFRK